MRPLFHFPFPCTQPPSQQPSPTATVPLQPEMCHRPHPAPMRRQHRSPALLSATRPPQGPGWQESHCMHPLLAKCAKKAPFLATSARNACFSRSRLQHLRPMHPFPGAIGRFGIHGARILPPRALFRVEEPETTHGAKMLPATRGMAERALRPAARAWPACRMRPPAISLAPAAACAPCHLARVHRRRLIRVALRRPHRVHRAQPSAAPPIAVGVSRLSVSSCCPRAAHADASRYLRAAPIPPAARTHRVQETSGTTQTTQCGHKNRIPKWGPY